MNLNLTNLLALDPAKINLLITAEKSAVFLPSPLREPSNHKILEFESKKDCYQSESHQSPSD